MGQMVADSLSVTFLKQDQLPEGLGNLKMNAKVTAGFKERKVMAKQYNCLFLDKPDMPETNNKRRICGHPPCKTKLSIYNLNDHCSAHRTIGIDAHWDKMEEIRFKKYQIQLKNIKKKAREKELGRA